MPSKIAFLGLGVMGHSMAKNLLGAGYPVAVWNRTQAKADALRSFGARVAETPSAAASGAEYVFSCVTDGAALLELIRGERGILSAAPLPKAVIDHSTISPEDACAVAELLRGTGVGFLDAPVTGGDVGARNGTLTIMIGGDATLIEAVRPMLSVMGKKIVHLGAVGCGQRGKCVNQIAVAGAVAAMAEALAFAEGAGLDLEKTLDVLRGGAAGSWALDNYGPRVLRGDFAPGFLAEHMLKDLRIALQVQKLFGTKLPLTELSERLYRELCETVPAGTTGNHGLSLLYRRWRDGLE